MSAASDYMATALESLDTQMLNLQTRLADDAAALAAALADIAVSGGDKTALESAAARVQATSDLVAGLALPTVVADPETPEVADTLA